MYLLLVKKRFHDGTRRKAFVTRIITLLFQLMVFQVEFLHALSNSGGGASTTTSSSSSTTRVNVSVKRLLPALSTPIEARTKFLEYVWEKGGGLPMLILPKIKREKTTSNDSTRLETTLRRRQLLPIMMEEEILETTSDDTDDSSICCQFQYQVKNAGILSSEIVPESHLGTVTFTRTTNAAPSQTETTETGGGSTITMTWDVSFDTTQKASRTFLWQFVTQQTIVASCNNFQAAMAVPRLYRRTTNIVMSSSSCSYSADIKKQWLQFCWKEGSGFPLPIPPILQKDGGVRWIVPPFLKERLVSTGEKNNDVGYAQIEYQVDNPSLFTYQVHSHRGRVRFVPTVVESNQDNDDDSTTTDSTTTVDATTTTAVRMEWDIEIRPYHGWSTFVEAFTGAVVSCYARNFKCHVQDEGDDETVMVVDCSTLLPKRSDDYLSTMLQQQSFLKIRKDSWIGGVLLDARRRLKDETALEQTIAFFQPWTWGRSIEYDMEDEGESWADGYLSD